MSINTKQWMFKKTRLAKAISYAAIPLLSGVATNYANAQGGLVIEEIIVTSSRREESVQDIPLNITAVDGATIQNLRLDNISKMAFYVPGLTVVDRGPRDEVPDIMVRGLNTTGLGPGYASDTVATYLGEIPLQVDLLPVDLERVEVLIGPQGTLYGQGTMGGAIRYIPNKADPMGDFTASLRGDFGSNAESDSLAHREGITLNIPIIENVLAIRANIDNVYDPGFIDYNHVVLSAGVSNPEPDLNDASDRDANIRQVEDANGEKTLSTRLNVRWLPNDWFDASLWYYRQNTEAEGRQQNNQLAFGTGRYESSSRYLEPNDYTNELFSLELTADFDFASASLVYGRTEYDELGQRDQTDLLLDFEYGYEFFPSFSSFTREEVEETTDTWEFRLVSQADSRLSWVAGLFFNELDSYAISEEFAPGFDQFAVDNFGGAGLRPDSLEYIQLTDVAQEEKAFYGELSYDIADNFTATVGYRKYQFDVNNEGGFGLPLADTVFGGEAPDFINVDVGENVGTDKGDLFKFNLSWDVTDSALLYVTYSEGYRNGGVNSVPECTPEQITSTAQQLCALSSEVFIDPDQIKNYEIGFKGLLLDNLSITAAAYFVDWKDLQVSTTTVNGGLPITGNGSEAESKGFELQSRWLINNNWDASFTYASTNAELTKQAPGLVGPFDALSGTRLPGHAKHQGSFSLNYNTIVMDSYDLNVNYGLIFASDVFNIPGGDEDTLVDDTGAAADRGGEAIPGYGIQHLSATLSKDSWSLQAYADNIFNKYYITGTRTTRRKLQDESNGPGNDINGFTLRSYSQFVGSPRTVGLRATYEF